MASFDDYFDDSYYNAVTDRYTPMSDRHRTAPPSYSKSEIDQSKYEKIRRELNKETQIDPNSSTYNYFYREINKLSNASNRASLEYMLSVKVAAYKSKIERWRKEAQQADMEEHRKLVAKYRVEWNKRNPLWRLFHQKYSPKKRNFDDVDNDIIERQIRSIRK